MAHSASVFKVDDLGQVFTPDVIVQCMLQLRRRQGRVLEPSCGDGAFWRYVQSDNAVAIELDATHCPASAIQMNFFDYPLDEKFDTIIGNPPYVRFKDIPVTVRATLRSEILNQRANLYLFFIEKCLKHLRPGGELIFITPRDFLKSTSATVLNQLLVAQGSITDVIDLGDARVFAGALPNCLIWRFEKGCFKRQTRFACIDSHDDWRQRLVAPHWQLRHFQACAGHLLFCRREYGLSLKEIAFVKVGAVSGADHIYASAEHGNRDFVCSTTVRTGQTRRMIWCDDDAPPPVLQPFRQALLRRRIRPFNDRNWWQWGRGYYQSTRPRVYVNGKKRGGPPFFLHDSPHYDGAILAVFPHRTDFPIEHLCDALNAVDWQDLGFICDGRYLFSQRSLENAPLPLSLRCFAPTP